MFNSTPSISKQQLEELPVNTHWQDTLPSLWQMRTLFALKVLKARTRCAANADDNFFLAHEIRCHNGMHTIHSFVYLSPAFTSLAQLESYTRDNAVDILHAHFHGSINNERSEISIAS